MTQSCAPGNPANLLLSSVSRGLTVLLLASSFACVHAETLKVGAKQKYKMPSEAAAIAKDGDTVEIDPGEYFDCALWKANRLTITGTGPNVVITEKTCNGKGLFVIDGNDVTVKSITLANARVPDGNGAGIREEGVNLTVDSVKFIKNQDGILTSPELTSVVEIRNSEFTGNGTCVNMAGCAHGIYIGHIAKLRVTNSKFFNTKEGHHIKSRAMRTEVIGNNIRDGESGTSSYLVEVPNGGSLVLENNVLEKGSASENLSAAVVIGAEGVTQRTVELVVKGNKFTNDNEHETVFVRNLTATPAILSGNTIKGKVKPLAGDGQVQ